MAGDGRIRTAVPVCLRARCLIASIRTFVAVPLGLNVAIYLAEFADSRVRGVIKPILEILAGVPTGGGAGAGWSTASSRS